MAPSGSAPGEHGHEHPGLEFVIELVVESREQVARAVEMPRHRAHLHAQPRHVERARHGLAGNVGNDQAVAAIAEMEEVVIVATDDACGGVAVGNAEAGQRRR